MLTSLKALAAFALALTNCNTLNTATPAVPVATTKSVTQSQELPVAANHDVCTGREFCVVGEAQIVGGSPGLRLLHAVINPPTAATGDERCERREFWLVGAAQRTLLLADCALQYGADSQGPANVRLSGSRLLVQYTEFQANDGCELVDATIDLLSVALERHARQLGSVTQDRCIPDGTQEPVPAVGDGSVGRPLLLLHRE